MRQSDGRVIGIAGVGVSQDNPPPTRRQLFFLYLRASEHGSGAGQDLLDEVLGDESVSLWVLEDNPRARAFYIRNGLARENLLGMNPRATRFEWFDESLGRPFRRG